MNRLLFATSLLCLSGSAQADFAGQFKACAAMVNGAERLACYDGLARQQSLETSAAPLSSVGPVSETDAEATVEPAPAPAASTAQQFGLEDLPKPESRNDAERERAGELMHARLLGSHKGWSPGSEFVLDNGQVWKNVDGSSAFYPLGENPAVTLEKGMLGAYWMSFEGLNKKVKVKRIK
ncbi:MAG: hypothetical protein HYV16_05785 [Gammaproteobacteria bacterium]|nr:hypothetical protein [Gammaproteobacteria bacterium]